MKRNLVVVRAGDSSLHGGMLDIPYAERNYDVLLSFFSESAYKSFKSEPGVSAVFWRGGKWDGLYKTLSQINIEDYDYFWLPDDDISCTGQDVNSVFEMTEKFGLAVSQPSLTHNSFFSHFIFFKCNGFRVRYSNFVEVMVPCLRRDLLKRVLPFFKDSMSGFGLDYIWCRMPESGPFTSGILDHVSVHHTRPVGKFLVSSMAKEGRDVKTEEETIKAIFKIKERVYPIVYAGVMDDGKIKFGKVKMSFYMIICWAGAISEFNDRARAYFHMYKVLSRAIRKPLNFYFLMEK